MNTENNKLIAEFMGYFPQDIVSKNGYLGWWSSPSNNFPNHDYKQIMFGAMLFHTSWDWLMPVIKKIQEDFIELDCDIFDGGHAHEVYGIEDAVWENNIGGAVIHVVSLIKALSSLEK